MKRQLALVTPCVIQWARETARFSIPVAAKKIGPDANRLKLYANGKSFTEIVFYSYKEGGLSGREASHLLDMKLNRMDKIMKMVENI